MNKIYQRVGWKNEPSVETPVNDENLGKMDDAIDILDDRIVELDNTKASQADYLQLQTVVSNQNQAISSAQRQISSLNGKTDQTNEAVNVLGQKTDGLIGDVENLKSKTDNTNSDVEELKTQSDSIAEEVSSLQENAEETDEVLTAQGKVLKQHEEALDNRIKKFYTNNLGENHIADSDDGVFRNIRIEGNSEQVQTTGAQLIVPVNKRTIERNGVTITYDNGIVTMNGTAQETLGYGLVDLAGGFLPPLEANTTYCLSTEPRNTYEQGKTYVHYWNNSLGMVGLTKSNGYGVFETNTTGTGETSANIAVYVENGVTYNNYSFSVQFEKASAPSPHEPYTGGQPSPSPDYPQEIKSADGMYTGKNKLPNDATTTTISGVTFTVNEDGSITANGKATANIRFNISEGFKLPQGDYLLSGIYHTLSACSISDNISDGTGAINIVISDGSDASIKVTNDNTTHNVYIGISSGKTVSNETIYPMIRPANTNSEYEPYTGGVPAPAPDKLVMKVTGRNLLDLRDGRSGTNGGITYVRNEDGSYERTGTATDEVGNVWFKGAYRITPAEDGSNVILTLEPGKTYLIKDCVLWTVSSSGVVESNWYTTVLTINANKYPDGFKVTGVRNPYHEIDKTYDDTVYPMIAEVASQNSDVPWKPYTEQLAPIPVTLRSVGEGENAVRDVMYVYADGTGKLVQGIEQNRVTTCAYFDVSNNLAYVNLTYYPTRNTMLKALSTHLIYNKAIYQNKKDWTFLTMTTTDASWSDYMRAVIKFPDGVVTSKADVENWLAEREVYFLYPLYEPIETSLTTEQVKALFDLRTHYGSTHISFESENGVEPTINFDYACSLENFVEYIKEQMGDERKFVYDMEDRLTQENKALEQYLDALLGME